MFYVGQKVVCVDTSDTIPGISEWRGHAPVEGRVYTVVGTGRTGFGNPGVLLLEIKNHAIHGGLYAARRFRPIVERKTDISIFTDMLKPADERVTA